MAVSLWRTFLFLLTSNALAIPSLQDTQSTTLPNPLLLNGDLNTSVTAELFHLSSLQVPDAINYRVPDTPITIRFFLSTTTIEAPDMARTLLQTQVMLRRYIRDHYKAAQDVLFPSDDPYISDLDLIGCFFAVACWPEDRPKRLTYGMVDNVLKGVWEFMYRGGRFVEANFEVSDEQLGRVGAGLIERGIPALNMRNVTQG